MFIGSGLNQLSPVGRADRFVSSKIQCCVRSSDRSRRFVVRSYKHLTPDGVKSGTLDFWSWRNLKSKIKNQKSKMTLAPGEGVEPSPSGSKPDVLPVALSRKTLLILDC